MSLHVAARSHPDELVGLLTDLLAQPASDPFAAEVVAVPTRGIERWLTQQIASELAGRGVGDGVCANVDFPSPPRLVREVLLAIPEVAASITAWEGTALVGHVLEALDSYRSEEWLWLIDRYIGTTDPSAGSSRRLGAAQRIARLYTIYARRRPAMIRRWAEGDHSGPAGEPMPDGATWQPQLWQLVREAIGEPSVPELMPAALAPLAADEITLSLPPRLAVYGLTAIDPLDLEVLEAVAVHRDVHLYVLHPSPALWQQTAATPGEVTPSLRRDLDATAGLAGHPLLASWGRESHELQLILQGRGHPVPATAPAETATPVTALARLQTAIRTNTPPAAAPPAAGDRSVQIHVCHGDRRQVEVLRDAVLQTLKADPTLEPRHIVIMTPDLDTFAPLLEAAFPEKSDGPTADSLPDLRVRIADRAPASTNPLVRFVATVVDLATGRLTASTVRELVADPVVRHRFFIDEDTAASLAGLVDDLNVKWGIDAAHRASWGAGYLDDHTWRRGLDRALAGVYLADSPVRVIDSVAPLEGVEGQDATVIGLLAQVIDRIDAVRQLLAEPRPRHQWGAAVATAVRLLAAPAWRDEWQLNQLERLLAESFGPDETEGTNPDLSLSEAERLMSDWTKDRPSPLHFRTGDITVCTLVPMRSVPYRVVCLLGMDDQRFPRGSRRDGDDLLADYEVVGDPSRTAEDRQLLLDAVMAAGDQLIVTYSGRDELTNAEYPPAVPIAELQDVLGVMKGPAGVTDIVTQHPLQGFSPTNFTPGSLGVAGPWSFDPMLLDGARAVVASQTAPVRDEPDLSQPLEVAEPITLDDVVAFLAHPARWFLTNHGQFTIPPVTEAGDDTLPVDVNALELWTLKDRLLGGLAEGHPIGALADHLRATDQLPPGELGTDDLQRAVTEAEALWAVAEDQGFRPQRHRRYTGQVTVDGHVVAGKVTADPEAHHIAVLTPSRLGAKRRLTAFAHLVFLTALDPDHAWRAVLMGRAEWGQKLKVVTVGPIAPGAGPSERRSSAHELLGGLVAIYVEGHERPIPLPLKTAYAWQGGLAKDRATAAKRADSAWATDRFSPEADDAFNAMVFPDLIDTDALINSEFPGYAQRLWGPILPLCVGKTP